MPRYPVITLFMFAHCLLWNVLGQAVIITRWGGMLVGLPKLRRNVAGWRLAFGRPMPVLQYSVAKQFRGIVVLWSFADATCKRGFVLRKSDLSMGTSKPYTSY